MDFVEHLKSAVDIVNVVSQYVRLKKVGQRYTGLCPFHTEKTASFNVNPAHQFYKCFGCGEGGDVIKFVEKIEGVSFYEALQMLAERNGIPLPKRHEYTDEETKLHAAIYRMHEIAFETFRAALNSQAGADARSYITRRGVAPAVSQEFGLGFAERSGQAVTRRVEKEGFTADQMEKSGLVIKRQEGGFFDRFRGRLMFPIHSESGKIIGFGGRALVPDDEPKYLNSPETPIYRKSHVLYNLHRAKEAIRKNQRAVLVEGYMDVIGVFSAGIKEVVASCGTALTSQQARSMKRFSDHIIVNFDPDTAGVNAAERSIQILLDENMKVRILELDGGLDPDEYAKERGADAYRAKLEGAGGYFLWLAGRARAKQDTHTAEGRIAVLQSLLPAIQRVADKIERVAIANEVASYLGFDQGLVLEHFRKAAAERRDSRIAPPRVPVPGNEQILLNSLLHSQEVRETIIPRLRQMASVEQFVTRRIFQALFALHESGARFGFAELDARLDDADKALLSQAAFADGIAEEHLLLDQAQASLRQLEGAGLASQKSTLKERIKEAERSGNMEEALRLTDELNRLSKR